MKHRPRRAVVGMIEIKWQQGRDRLAAVECAHHAESARFRKRQARAAIRLELGWRIHVELLLDVGAGGSDRAVFEGNAADRIQRQTRPYTQTTAHPDKIRPP